MKRLARIKEKVTVPTDAVGALARLFCAQILEFPKKIGPSSLKSSNMCSPYALQIVQTLFFKIKNKVAEQLLRLE